MSEHLSTPPWDNGEEYEPEYDEDNRCTLCGEHLANPHAPECPRGDGEES